MSTKLKLMGVDVASLGDAHGITPGSLCTVYVDERKGVYKSSSPAVKAKPCSAAYWSAMPPSSAPCYR